MRRYNKRLFVSYLISFFNKKNKRILTQKQKNMRNYHASKFLEHMALQNVKQATSSSTKVQALQQ